MLLPIADLLTQEQVRHARQLLDSAEWIDGRVTAGHQSARAKDNVQLPESSPAARELRDLVLGAARVPCLISAALPLQVFPPLFNAIGASLSALTSITPSVRSPAVLSAFAPISPPLFFTNPDEYEGGNSSSKIPMARKASNCPPAT